MSQEATSLTIAELQQRIANLRWTLPQLPSPQDRMAWAARIRLFEAELRERLVRHPLLTPAPVRGTIAV